MKRDQLIAAIKATASAPPAKVTVEGWGDVFVKTLTVEQVDLQQQAPEVEGKDPYRIARGAARVLCDEGGVLLFDPDSEADLKVIAALPWERLSKVLAAAGLTNATTEPGSEAAKNG